MTALSSSTKDTYTGDYKFSAHWVPDDKCENWRAFWTLADNAAVVGYDSEFYGCDIAEESPVGKAKVDVFSAAIPGHPCAAGFSPCTNFVFEGKLLRHPQVRSKLLEYDGVAKPIHNQPADAHAAANHGVVIRGGINTLSMARWVYPERANLPRGNFDLDSLCRWRVGFGKTEDFEQFLTYKDWEEYQDEVTKKRCECGELGCRKKKGAHASKTEERVVVTRRKQVQKVHSLPDVRPGGKLSDLFPRYLTYAAADAELAVIIYQMMLIDGRKERRYPYPMVGPIAR